MEEPDHRFNVRASCPLFGEDRNHIMSFEGQTDKHCSIEAAEIIIEIITAKQWTFLEESLRLLRAHELAIHPITVPSALSHLSTKSHLWNLLLDTTDDLARWLALQNSDWQWFIDLKEESSETAGETNDVDRISWNRKCKEIALLPNQYQNLTATGRKKMLTTISSNPISLDEPFLRWVLDQRSRGERTRALKTLIRLETLERKMARDLAKEVVCPNIYSQQGTLCWQRHKIALPGALIDLSEDKKMKPDKFLLSTISPHEVFDHINLDHDEICRQVMTDPALSELGEAIVTSIHHQRDEMWIERLARFWLKHYPRFNTQQFHLPTLLGLLDRDQFAKLLSILITLKDAYFIEKLTLFVKNTIPYASGQVSKLLITELILVSQNNLTRTDMKWLKELLPIIVWRLDPRSHMQLAKLWPEANLHYSPLQKEWELFRVQLEKRFELFNYIADSK